MRAHGPAAFLLVGAAILLDAAVSAAQGWQLVDPLPTPRFYHAAATVGGRWYVAGGVLPADAGQDLPTEVDVYDPTTGHWTVLGQLAQGRQFPIAVADPSRGRVVFSSGFLPMGSGGPLALGTCDMASSDGVSPAPSLLAGRYLGAAAVAAGKLVVSGGFWAETSLALFDDAEVWDGTSGAWMAAGKMPAGTRAGHTMTTLKNGREVLVVGGGLPVQSMREVDLFDAASGTWSPAAPLKEPRARHSALLLDDGRVLVVGGVASYPGGISGALSSAELFDPATGAWRPAASMMERRLAFDMVLLPDGRVLAAGGSNSSTYNESGALSSVEVYDPVADTWTSLPPMRDRRYWPTMAVLSDGVYVAGGFSPRPSPGGATVLASVERLVWSDLGIGGPVDGDAGVPDGSALDAAPRDGSEDTDVRPDDAAPADGSLDASQGLRPTDPGIARRGCSCSAGRGRGGDVFAILVVLCVAFIAAFRHRRGLLGR